MLWTDQPLLGDAKQPHGPSPVPCSSHLWNSFYFAKVYNASSNSGISFVQIIPIVVQDFYPCCDKYPATYRGGHRRQGQEEGERHKEDAGKC